MALLLPSAACLHGNRVNEAPVRICVPQPQDVELQQLVRDGPPSSFRLEGLLA